MVSVIMPIYNGVPYLKDAIVDILNQYCFVNLDMDLYQPTYEGLKFFYPRMKKGGVILVHDYFSGFYLPGVKNAVYDYERDSGTTLLKITSECSSCLIIVKP